MRNIFIIIAVVLVAAAAMWFFFFRGETLSVNNTEDTGQTNEEELDPNVDMPEESTTTMATGTYSVDTEESLVTWRAGKPAIAGYVHTGTFKLESGEVELNEELSGEFVIDVDSLEMVSLGGGKAGQESTLEGHLKGERFFDTETHPTATFTVTDVTPKELPGPDREEYTATGELTLKGQTHEVSFPMRVVVENDNEVWMSADLTIDRTLWGIDFGSASIAEEITDNIIGDEVQLELLVKLDK